MHESDLQPQRPAIDTLRGVGIPVSSEANRFPSSWLEPKCYCDWSGMADCPKHGWSEER